MATFKISELARNAACDAIVDLIDGGAGAGYVEVRTGTPPTNTTDADSGTLLATLPMSDPAFGAASAGVATASAVTDDSSADATGVAGHFRVKDSNAVTIIQGYAGESADSPNLTFDDKNIVSGYVVKITAMTLTVQNTGT